MWESPIPVFLSLKASFFIILQNWPLFFHLLMLQIACAIWISKVLGSVIHDQDLLITLSFLGGILGGVLFCMCLVILKITPTPLLGMVVLFVSLGPIIWHIKRLKISVPILWIAVFLFFILLVQLLFVQDLLVPPYADSVTHLEIVQDLMNPNLPSRAFFHPGLDPNHYYHFGFHALSAWLSGITSINPERTILILGQYFQVLAILGIYPLVRILSRNILSAWIAMSIAGLLLPIPFYASNWGKYPAIASLAGITFTLALFLIHERNKPLASSKFWWLVGFSMVVTTCLHSRSILFLVLSTGVVILNRGLKRHRSLLFFSDKVIEEKGTVLEVSGMAMLYYVLTILIVFYMNSVLEFELETWLLLSFVVLAISAFMVDFIFSAILLISIFIMWGGYSISLEWLQLPARFIAIFDRPFLVIVFYIPVCLFMWRGLEGGIWLFFREKFNLLQRRLFIGVLSFGLINTLFIQSHHPSECCILLKDDDLFSFEWMQQNLPEDAIVGIAAIGRPGNYLPVDGGAWIEHFYNIHTRKLDSTRNFLLEKPALCAEDITYFYLDNLENSFDEYNLWEAGGVYQFGMGDVKIYKINCETAPKSNPNPYQTHLLPKSDR